MANADMIFILNKYDEVIGALSNTLPYSTPYFEDLHTEILENGYETFEFKTPIFHPSGIPDYIKEENKLLVLDSDDIFHVFRIKRVQDNTVSKQKIVFAETESIELLNDPIRPITVAGSPQRIMDQILFPSRWQTGTIETATTNSLVLEEHTSVLAALHETAKLFDLEIRFRITFNGSRITGRYVDLLQRRGNPKGSFFEYSQDIQGLTRTKDTTELATALIGVGKSDDKEKATTFQSVKWSVSAGNPVDKPLGQDWVGDANALQQFGVEGRHIFRVFMMPDESDPMRLLSATWDELQRRIKGSIEYEVDLVLLEKMPGYAHKQARIGDTITIKDTSFATPLILEARILEMKRSRSNPSNDAVVLGEYREREITESELIRRLQAELAKKSASWEMGGGGFEVIESPTPPTDPPIGQFWLNTSKNPNIWNRWDGTNWIPATPEFADQLTYADGLPIEYYKPNQPGADKTGDNTAKDTVNVGGTPSGEVRDEAQAGKNAQDKIQTEVGTGTIETTAGAARKSGPVSTVAPTNPQNGDKWVDISKPGLEVWKKYNSTTKAWDEIGRVSLDQLTGQIITAQITPGAIGTTQLADLAITLGKMATNSVDVNKIVNNAVSEAKIQTDAITTVKIKNDAVDVYKIVNNAISSAKIQTDAVTNLKIQNDSIDVYKIVNNAISSAKIQNDAIITSKIITGAVTTNEIATNTIQAVDIASKTITGDRLVANTITATEIAGKTITAAQITASTITTNEIAVNTIQAVDIASKTITGDRLVANTITATEIASRTILADRLVSNSITSNEIMANTIVASDILANSITGDRITSRTISADRLIANSITANEIASKTITAAHIASNTITTDLISATGISADVIKGGTISANVLFAGQLNGAKGTFSGMVTVGTPTNGVGLTEISTNGIKSTKRTTINASTYYEYVAEMSSGVLQLTYKDANYSLAGEATATLWMNEGLFTIDLWSESNGYYSPGRMGIMGSLNINENFDVNGTSQFGGESNFLSKAYFHDRATFNTLADFKSGVTFSHMADFYYFTSFNYQTSFNKETYFYGAQYDYSQYEPVTNRAERGFCGIGGFTSNAAVATTAFIGVGVNFRKRKTYIPSSITLSPTSQNLVYSTHVFAIDISYDGFWLYIYPGQANVNIYRYWRGYFYS